MEPLFSASKTALNENGKSAKTREWLQKVAFVSDTVPMMPPKIKPRIFNAVSEALYRDSKLRVKFHNSRGEENEAVVSPLGLVQQVQRLYLICQFEGYNNIRHLALHRMDEAEVTAFPSVRPQDFSLSQYVASRHFNYSNGGKIHLLIEFTNPETAVNLSETPFNPTQTLQQLEDGAWRLEADMDDTVQLTGWIEAWRERGGFRKVEKTPIEA
ncbi:helix-turn-helix transcriptional regulator [Sutterella wadsworthensis]|jgi:predicted DNA-binding transcriptional regulator YafY